MHGIVKEKVYFYTSEIDSRSSKYDNFLLLGVFNSEPTEEAMKGFC